jgi:hypothetical protein
MIVLMTAGAPEANQEVMGMRRWICGFSPATVMGAVALFVSLGGVGYAAATIGSAQIANNSVRSKDFKDRTILRKDINRKAIASLRGRKGEPGQPGPAGPPGSALAFAHVNADGSVDAGPP